MKMRALIRRAHEIISEEHEHVLDEYRSDDGTFTEANRKAANAYRKKYGDWLADANKVLHPNSGRAKGARRRHPSRPKKLKHKIVVEH